MNNKTMIRYRVYEMVYKKQYTVSHLTKRDGTKRYYYCATTPTPEFDENIYDECYLGRFDKQIDLKFMIGERIRLSSGKVYTIVNVEHVISESTDCAPVVVLYVEGSEKLIIDNVEGESEALMLANQLNSQQ